MIEAALLILDTLLDVFAMVWRFVRFVFGRIPRIG